MKLQVGNIYSANPIFKKIKIKKTYLSNKITEICYVLKIIKFKVGYSMGNFNY